MNDTPSPEPDPAPAVRLKRHQVDWEASADLEDITALRIATLGQRVADGCWFLNPRYTVSAAAPTAEFFRAALHARSAWLRTCRQVLGNSGYHHQAREVQRQGQRVAFAGLHWTATAEGPTQSPPESIPWAARSRSERREVVSNGQLARQLACNGVMFIDGVLLAPRYWQAMADEALGRRPDSQITIAHRPFDLAALKATGDPESLMRLSRSALREHLELHPSCAAYINPQCTVSAPSASGLFYEEVNKCQDRWCTTLNRRLGCGHARRARRAADAATVALAYRGVLVIASEVYLPGCWPNQNPSPNRLKRAPFGTPTVPLGYLGLAFPPAAG